MVRSERSWVAQLDLGSANWSFFEAGKALKCAQRGEIVVGTFIGFFFTFFNAIPERLKQQVESLNRLTLQTARVEVSPLKIAKRCKICGEFE